MAVLENSPKPIFDDEQLEEGSAPSRSQREIGGFLKLYSGVRGGGTFGGYGTSQSSFAPRPNLAIDVALGAGLSAEGITTHTSDGVYWLQLGAIAQTAQPEFCDGCSNPNLVHSRMGWGFRVRAPFYAIPGDGLIFGTLAALGVDVGTHVTVAAARGGMSGIERVNYGKGGRLQIMLGREFALHRYASANVYSNANGVPLRRTSATELDFPFLEYRPLRLNFGNLTNTIAFQLGTAVDLNSIGTAVTFYLRFGNDARIFW
jgi:hypothetical protein